MAGGSSPRADFVGPRLRIARAFHGLEQTELAERVWGSRRTLLGQLEVGARLPEPDLVAALARELGFSRAFFAAPLLDEGGDDECHGPRGPARRRAVAHAALLAELVAWLDDRVELPAESLPEEVSAADPEAIEAAAATCRRLWGLAPDLPIPNLTRVVERAGVVVARVEGAAPFARVGRRLWSSSCGGGARRGSGRAARGSRWRAPWDTWSCTAASTPAIRAARSTSRPIASPPRCSCPARGSSAICRARPRSTARRWCSSRRGGG